MAKPIVGAQLYSLRDFCKTLEDTAKTLEKVKARCTVISITSDQLFPPKQLRDTAETIKQAKYYEINSIFGHDGFLIENDQLAAILKPLIQ